MIYIFGGGTVNYVRNHFALSAPAYGTTARKLSAMLDQLEMPNRLMLTKMADYRSPMETNADVELALNAVLNDPLATTIIFNVALCDFYANINSLPAGKYAQRLQTRSGTQVIELEPARKLITKIKSVRPDIFLVGFKTTADEPETVLIDKMHRQAAETGADVVFGNDTFTRNNVLMYNNNVVVASTDRDWVLSVLVHIMEEHR